MKDRKAYSEIFLHLVWHTKTSLPLIRPAIENELRKYLVHRITETPGAACYAVGGTETHVHIAVSVPPSLTPSKWIGELKGASSHHVNEKFGRGTLQWQAGYGVISFGKNNLDFVTEYIEHQKEHHAANKIHERLEIIGGEEE